MTFHPEQSDPEAIKPLGFATIDLQRQKRCGIPEVIFGQGKTPEQIVSIAEKLQEAGQPVLATRLSAEAQDVFSAAFPVAEVHASARTATVGKLTELGTRVAVCAAGTSDLPVAEEAAVAATFLGNSVTSITDIGVAGLHRLLARLDEIREHHVVIAVAGMEGALPSVVAGLIDVPLIAVPTSVGYGANLQGVTALCGMLTSCSSGVTVVNIDNGFGAAYAATQITRLLSRGL